MFLKILFKRILKIENKLVFIILQIEKNFENTIVSTASQGLLSSPPPKVMDAGPVFEKSPPRFKNTQYQVKQNPPKSFFGCSLYPLACT